MSTRLRVVAAGASLLPARRSGCRAFISSSGFHRHIARCLGILGFIFIGAGTLWIVYWGGWCLHDVYVRFQGQAIADCDWKTVCMGGWLVLVGWLVARMQAAERYVRWASLMTIAAVTTLLFVLGFVYFFEHR